MSAAPSEVVLDTSAWLALFNDEPGAADLEAYADARLVTTPIVLAEVGAHARLGRVRRADPVDDIERKSRLEQLTRDDAVLASETYARLRLAGRGKLSLADTLIHATALRIGAQLVTLDADLRGEPGVTALASPRRRK